MMRSPHWQANTNAIKTHNEESTCNFPENVWVIYQSETNFPHPLSFLGTFTHFQYRPYFIKSNSLWEDSNLMGKERQDKLQNTMLLPKL